MRVRSCIRSMRLRTLPLSLSGIVMGVFLAVRGGEVDFWTVLFLFLTTICLQILTNLSNELGDTLNGTDRDDRIGMIYSLQEGEISIPEMKNLIRIIVVLSLIFGASMIYASFGTFLAVAPIVFLILGAVAVWVAMHYTLGKNPYGYRGFGDIAVFIFFGIATVYGGYYLCAHTFLPLTILLPACAIGFFCVAVLNVNNIRDMKSDALTRKTVAIRMGEKRAKIYQTFLIIAGWIAMTIYCLLLDFNIMYFLYIPSIVLFIKHLKGVWTLQDSALDAMVPLLVMGTFAFALLSGIGLQF